VDCATTVIDLPVALEGDVVEIVQALYEQEQCFGPVPAAHEHPIEGNTLAGHETGQHLLGVRLALDPCPFGSRCCAMSRC